MRSASSSSLYLGNIPTQTGIFLSAIKGLQQFDKESVINFINEAIIRPGFEVTGIILGKLWGAANPAYGELMGTAIGYAIGTYMDDFVSMYLAARYFRKCLKPMGLTLMNYLYPRVSWQVAKTALIFGLKVSLPCILPQIPHWEGRLKGRDKPRG